MNYYPSMYDYEYHSIVNKFAIYLMSVQEIEVL